MIYTPKCCSECGEKIELSKWKMLVGYGYCETCEGELKIHDWIYRIKLGILIVLAIFGIGSFLKKSETPLNVSTTPALTVASNKSQNVRNTQVPVNTSVQLTQRTSAENAGSTVQSNNQTPVVDPNQQKTGTVAKQDPIDGSTQNPDSETVYFCGAQTKKGMPCSRRVKIKGSRCWQHEGLPAMLPPEKLVASRR